MWNRLRYWGFKQLEPDAGKLARPVLRGGNGSNAISLPGAEMRAAYKGLEAAATTRLLRMLPDELKGSYAPLLEAKDAEVARLVKAADKLCALLKCVQEVQQGNREFVLAETALRGQLRELGSHEADYFLDTFGDSFLRSLDDLQNALPNGAGEP